MRRRTWLQQRHVNKFTHIHAYTNTHIDTHTEARTHTHTHTKSCAVLVRLLLVSSYTYFILKYDTPG